jgi:hypothetical protein
VLRRAADESPELACYLLVAAATGARRSEVVALRWRDVAFDDGVLSIERGIVFGPDGLVEKDTKTHAVRRVALDAGTLAALDAHRALMGARGEMCGVSLVEDAFVFSNSPDGSAPWFPDSVSRSFKRLCALDHSLSGAVSRSRSVVVDFLRSAGTCLSVEWFALDGPVDRRPRVALAAARRWRRETLDSDQPTFRRCGCARSSGTVAGAAGGRGLRVRRGAGSGQRT